MKKTLKNSLVIILGITFLSITSCSSDSDSSSNTPDNTITGIASRTSNLSTLVAALNKAGLAATLKGTGPYTVFAPTNDAFDDFLAENGYDNLDAVPVATLKEILLNHVVSGENTSSSLSTGYVKTLSKGSASSTNTLSMFINTASGVKINGISNVTTADVDASNGVVHIVDAVIGLPTVAAHAKANSNFTTLVSLLNRPGQPNFESVLSNPGTYTVFAPTNDAFTALNTELEPTGGIAAVSADNITKILQYHVVSEANVLSSQLTEGQNITPILTPSQTFQVLLSGGAKLKDASNRQCNIIATDVQCSNGIIHVLSKVLLPNL